MTAPAATALASLVNRRRVVRLSAVTLMQILVQLLGFAAGLFVVHSTTPQQYGLFTLLLAAVGLGNVLVDLGLASGAMAVGGRTIEKPGALASVLAQARWVQVRMLALLLPLVVGVLVVTLLHQQAGAVEAALLAGLAGGIVLLNARNGLWLVGARLTGQVALQQRLELSTTALRAGLLGAVAMAAITIDAALAAAVTLVAAGVYGAGLRRLARPWARAEDAGDAPAQRRALWQAVTQQAPNSIYFAFSNQVAVGLIAFAGSTQQVAEVGALGRLGALFALVTSVSGALVLPYFARQRSAAAVRQGLGAVHVFFAALLAVLLVVSLQGPGLVLWLLGPNYRGLEVELPWLLAAGALTCWGGTLYGIGCARGWVLPFAWSAAGGGVAIVITAACVDLSSVRSVLAVNLASAAATLALAAAFISRRLRAERRSAP